jgi:hypothetical protein
VYCPVVSDGTTHIVYTPHELIEKLIPLIPRPMLKQRVGLAVTG